MLASAGASVASGGRKQVPLSGPVPGKEQKPSKTPKPHVLSAHVACPLGLPWGF